MEETQNQLFRGAAFNLSGKKGKKGREREKREKEQEAQENFAVSDSLEEEEEEQRGFLL